MADEISASLNVTITQGGQSVSGAGSFTATLSSTSFIGEEITIGDTSAATVYVSGLTNPAVFLIINQSTDNFITVDNVVTLDNFPQKLLAGQGVLLLPDTGTIYAKADTAPCQAWVVAG